jgi:hypothetical protein
MGHQLADVGHHLEQSLIDLGGDGFGSGGGII